MPLRSEKSRDSLPLAEINNRENDGLRPTNPLQPPPANLESQPSGLPGRRRVSPHDLIGGHDAIQGPFKSCATSAAAVTEHRRRRDQSDEHQDGHQLDQREAGTSRPNATSG
jgi:hypothetical protein